MGKLSQWSFLLKIPSHSAGRYGKLYRLLGLLFLLIELNLSSCAFVNSTGSVEPVRTIRTEVLVGDTQSSSLSTATPGGPPQATPTVLIAGSSSSYDHSVLTEAQKERLYRASLEYLADTESEAIRVARDLRFVENEGHPANFCGPLSIGILRDAGLVDRYTDLHDFWLLNPRDEYTVENILEKTFPKEDYLWYRSLTPINEFDFTAFPLYTGDFIYLYAGPRGTFEHIMTVSRVDEQGRAFSITAETYNNSYLISELMLYDPQQPGRGYFYDITDPEYSELLGVTGLGGFQLWRSQAPISDPTPEEGAFRNRMDKIFETYGGEWHVLVKEIEGEVLYALDPNEVIHPASVIKVPMAMAFFEALSERDIDDLRLFLVEKGTDGRTYQQLLSAMLVDSEEDAFESLFAYTEESFRTIEKLNEWGYQFTSINPRRTTATEITRVFEELWLGEHLTEEQTKIILEQLAVYTTSDDTRIGVIRNVLPEGSHYYSKRGSVVTGRVIVGEVAILDVGETAFIISIFGSPDSGETTPTFDEIEEAIEDAAWVIWGYVAD
jgi:hypothetical protein